jgi:peroxiredoxin
MPSSGRLIFIHKGARENMPKVELNTTAPGFSLMNFKGEIVSLADYKGKSNILLVFNRGFT